VLGPPEHVFNFNVTAEVNRVSACANITTVVLPCKDVVDHVIIKMKYKIPSYSGSLTTF